MTTYTNIHQLRTDLKDSAESFASPGVHRRTPASDDAQFRIEVTYEASSRVLGLQWQPKFEELKDVLSSLFPGLPEEYLLKYKDEDNDLITLTSNEELMEAVDTAQRQSRNLSIHVFAKTKSSSAVFQPASPPSSTQFIKSNSESSISRQNRKSLGVHRVDSKALEKEELNEELKKQGLVPGNPLFCGWAGDLNRQEAEDILKGKDDKTFLVRWSARPKSYVLSYVAGVHFDHIAHIKPVDGRLRVSKTDNSVSVFKNLEEYIEKMMKINVIKHPVDMEAEKQKKKKGPSKGEMATTYDRL